MKAIFKSSLLCLALLWCELTEAQIYETNNVVVQSFVGSGFYGHVDGQGALTMFHNPSSIVVDSSSNFFVLDQSNYRIRRITPDGTVSTFIGGGQMGLPGFGTNVSLSSYSFNGMAIDRSDVLWITTPYSSLLRVAPNGLVQAVSINGLGNPWGVCVDSRNNVYVSDINANKIYRLGTNWTAEIFAGSGNSGSVDGNGIFNSFSGPAALAADAADNIYVWDSQSRLIRRINQNRDVVTVAGKINVTTDEDGVGTNASFSSISGMTVDASGNLILSCGYPWSSGSGNSIRKLTASMQVVTVAGSFTASGYANGAGQQALFSGASGVCVSQGIIFVGDAGNHRIRRIVFDSIPQHLSPADLQLGMYPGLKLNGTAGGTYRIESSPDMNTWNAEVTLLLPSSPYLWIDKTAAGAKKFYRAVLLP